MLTRKEFWISIFGFREGRARQLRPQEDSAPAWRRGESLNDQCPVCGTMAESYVIEDAGHFIPCSHPKPGQVCIAPVPGIVPGFRTIRCKRCNVRFDQNGV